jgi:ATP-binding cassette, subfamily B, bacterial CvaB/MchF/RaxB
MIAGFHGSRATLFGLRSRFGISMRGASFRTLKLIALELGFSARGLKVPCNRMDQVKFPCIVQWNANHFVVACGIEGRRVHINDPALGQYSVGLGELHNHFTGYVLEVQPTSALVSQADHAEALFAPLVAWLRIFRRPIMLVISMTAGLELLALCLPWALRWVVDHGAAATRAELGYLALAAFAAVVAQCALTVVRGRLVSSTNADFTFEWMAGTLRHLLQLPAEFFERRSSSDVVNRFSSIAAIQRTATSSAIQGFVDGLLAIVTLGVMLVLFPVLGGVSALCCAAYLLFRILAYAGIRRSMSAQVMLSARQHSNLLDTLNNIRSLKVFNRTAERHRSWCALLQSQLANERSHGSQLAHVQAAQTLLIGMDYSALVFAGGYAVSVGSLTAGALVAYMLYRFQFISRLYPFLDRCFEVRTLGIHMMRLHDLTAAAPEPESGVLAQACGPPSISLESVWYRYSRFDPYVLKKVSMHIEAGEFVAIRAPSGAGKTTLVKLVIGLLKPTGGRVLLGGEPLERIGLRSYRSIVGAVLQTDRLMPGTILDNVTLFDEVPDRGWARDCVRTVGMEQVVEAAPMGYDTLVGEAVSGWSSGQEQRLLLARALYKRPAVMVLDEATCHLDIESERVIDHAVRQMKITRIVVTHRPDTLLLADRVIDLTCANNEPEMDLPCNSPTSS